MLAAARLRLTAEHGYTMIETLTTIAILTIVITGIVTGFVSASHAEIDMNKRFQAQQQALLALNALRREVHCADTVTQVDGSALASAPAAYSGIRITLNRTGVTCPTGTGTVTWCTRTTNGVIGLWRTPGSSCTSTGGVKKADYLIADHAFSLPASPPATPHLSTIHVAFRVNVDGASATRGTYELTDDIVMRNSSRQ